MGNWFDSVRGLWSKAARRCSQYFLETPGKRWASAALLVFSIVLLTSSFIYWTDVRAITGTFFFKTSTSSSRTPPNKPPVKLKCINEALTLTCPTNYPVKYESKASTWAVACPEYFRWIREDLRPWRDTGITRQMVERGNKYGDLRLVIVKGKAYVKMYRKAFQTRDVFTVWGILQLLRLYPGKVPDLELLFACGDRPVVKKRDYHATYAPPVFHYCVDDESLDIPFPDWSFWGWGEINIRPWGTMLWGLREANKRIRWKDRKPYAFWKGNPSTSGRRADLMKCNVSDKQDWNARVYAQDWRKETEQGFKQSHLEDQCTHRYKIFIEGVAWSVSDKYILGCDSMTLLVKPKYFDFFTRSLVAKQHYWPISPSNLCRDIKFAVDWGNNNTDKAQAIGKAASKFIQEDLKMEFVYDYTYHLLREYAKLMRFTPTIPPGAVEVCSETMACPQNGPWRQFMMESMVMSPKDTLPCTMPSSTSSSSP
ncbi:uncharacterized protein LOC132188480 [Corylus avellana]|uniref:uncharacterized protein LOC132188480 n=1 Tax=Corylus avellana TaxID=13451 RepID=UPI00286C34D8|nr:uncharacterized protein LOC132188480 [Corylus avellana]